MLTPSIHTTYLKEVLLDFGKIHIYNNFMLAEINEEIVLDMEKCAQIVNISEIYFRHKNFAYITLRRNSYSVDPIIYLEVSHIKNLKAFAIVSSKETDYYNIKIEKHFLQKPLEIFQTVPEAIAWVETIL
ncbi:hypothetical protein [Imtechella halotolerans]|uniref:STAS/SEC14 domain-containing protein n=1 Tax=Imtechella halotolerans K1 TaxID=946077 RepID=I0WG48_9FLAO|nr:hypothetical protein [Imtechella halotolerans]EID75364.1 hypothetical protein W5A_06366 [Imtechella halotolerans K1]WMQ63738.1 STAS/SEC14 domain-containing protein [Imtechella halotolerans]